jgi:hypothetical protein
LRAIIALNEGSPSTYPAFVAARMLENKPPDALTQEKNVVCP